MKLENMKNATVNATVEAETVEAEKENNMNINTIKNTAVNTKVMDKDRAKELNYGIITALNNRIPVKSLTIVKYEDDITVRFNSDMLFTPVSKSVCLTKWDKGEVAAKATFEQTMKLMSVATEERIMSMNQNGWTMKGTFFLYQLLEDISAFDDVTQAVTDLINGEIVENSDDEWLKALAEFDTETAAAQNAIDINLMEGVTIPLYAYNKDGEYYTSTYKMSLKGVCGMTAVAEKYPLFERYASNSTNVEDAVAFNEIIAEAKELKGIE